MISQWIYDASLTAYRLVLRGVAPFNGKAAKMLAGRSENYWEVLSQEVSKLQKPVVWFHCASLGEFEQARPVIEAFRSTYPEYAIVLTFFSPSGYEVQKNYAHADLITYLPFDTATHARRFIAMLRPALVFFVKYEFWYHYLTQLKAQSIPLFIFSAIFRPEQPFFEPYGSLHRQMLACFTHIFVQQTASKDLLATIGIEQVTVTGDTRLDRVLQIAQNLKDLTTIKAFQNNSLVWVVGSSWQEDLAVVLPAFLQIQFQVKLIIAPHELSENSLLGIEKALSSKKVLRYSQATQLSSHELAMYDVLLIDNIGWLSSIYSIADFVFVGGAYKDGLHNIIEPAVYGMPIYFGQPYYKKFQEALDLLALGGVFTVKNSAELVQLLTQHHENSTLHQNISQINRQYVAAAKGSTQKVLNAIGIYITSGL
ncbi:MAG: 3-deoxy-D-manno-octulosonic acid transferase [Thermoflexibacteraceae bacterium]